MTEARPVCELPGLDPDSYTRWRASDVGAITERLERRLILDLVGDVRGRGVLDVGCGDGDLAVELSKRGAHVVGIDTSEPMIAAARGRATEERIDVDFRVATARRLPFLDEHFDIVVAVTVLCFVEDAAPVFREMARVLHPGGHLVIGELGKWNSWAARGVCAAGSALPSGGTEGSEQRGNCVRWRNKPALRRRPFAERSIIPAGGSRPGCWRRGTKALAGSRPSAPPSWRSARPRAYPRPPTFLRDAPLLESTPMATNEGRSRQFEF